MANLAVSAIGSQQPEQSAKQFRRVCVEYALTLLVGLAVAGTYIGYRLSATVPDPGLTVPKVAVAAVGPPPAAVAPAPAPFVRPIWHGVNPRPGERYLQLGALAPLETDEYLAVLQSKGILPLIGPGPAEGIYRILLGPFKDPRLLARQKLALEAIGVTSFERVYVVDEDKRSTSASAIPTRIAPTVDVQ